MRSLIVIICLTITVYGAKVETKSKRGLIEEGILFEAGGHGLSSGFEIGHGDLSFASEDLDIDHGSILAADRGVILGASINKHITLTKNIGVPIPQPYPVPIEKTIAIPIPHAVPVPVDKPYPVAVNKPIAIPVDKPIPITVEKAVPYPVSVPVKIPVRVQVAVPVPKPIAIPIHKALPVPIIEPVQFLKSIPIAVKATPIISVGSGSLGYADLGDGHYAIGSGSLGYSDHGLINGYGLVAKGW